MLAKIYSSGIHGVEAMLVTIEVSITRGLGYQITGLPDESIKESLSRIAIAIHQAGFEMPRTKLLIHLSPAHIRKTGSAFDLPIAIGILVASGQLQDNPKLSENIFMGELALDGTILPVRGALCASELTARKNMRGIILPQQNTREGSLITNTQVYGVSRLQQVIEWIKGDAAIEPSVPSHLGGTATYRDGPDFKNVMGQENLKRAMEIAAAGGHHAIMIGPPGTGKSLIAQCLPSILPPMSDREILETSKIYNVLDRVAAHEGLIKTRPFRAVHHTISDAGLVGGGLHASPGEITLAHNGVLFMDELAEFKGAALEALRQPMEDRKIIVARSKHVIEYPAAFMLVAAMNPCLCGYHNHPVRKCTCSKRALYWYRRKISGPLLDRMDIQVEADPVHSEILPDGQLRHSESSAVVHSRVRKARLLQLKRFEGNPDIHCNAMMSAEKIAGVCNLDNHTRRFLQRSLDNSNHSARGVHKILRVARTIADLAGSVSIELGHVAEAIHFRALDKFLEVSSRDTSPAKTASTIYHTKINGYDLSGF